MRVKEAISLEAEQADLACMADLGLFEAGDTFGETLHDDH